MEKLPIFLQKPRQPHSSTQPLTTDESESETVPSLFENKKTASVSFFREENESGPMDLPMVSLVGYATNYERYVRVTHASTPFAS